MNKNSFIKPFIIFLTILIYTDNIVAHAIVLQNITSTAIQSSINGDSFTESLKHQAINTIVMAGANYTANQIGGVYHTGEINKTEQLLFHALLGAGTNALTGNDALSGAVAGVSGEIFAELLGNSLYGTTSGNILTEQQKNTLKESGGLAAGITSLFVGKAKGLDVSDIRNNVYAGYRVGKNAVENNLTLYLEGTDLTGTRKEKESTKHSLEMAKLASNTLGNDPYKKVGTVFWKGENTKEGRTNAAYDLFSYVSNYEFAPDEPLNIIGHSHGGNVIKEFTNIYAFPQEITNFNNLTGANIGNMTYMPKLVNYKTVDNALLNGTPHRNDYRFNMTVMTPGQKPIAVSDRWDIITQDVFGGTDFMSNETYKIFNKATKIPKIDTITDPSKSMDGAINIEIKQVDKDGDSVGKIKSHTDLNTQNSWKEYIDPAVRNIINNKKD